HYLEYEIVAILRVCAHCGYHFPVTARERIVQLVDEGSWSEVARDLSSADPLEFVDTRPYGERLEAAERQTGLHDAMLVGAAEVGGLPIALAVMDFTFLGGSMGAGGLAAGRRHALPSHRAPARPRRAARRRPHPGRRTPPHRRPLPGP